MTDIPQSAHQGGDTTTLSAVVPCYNEQDNLRELQRRITAACKQAVGESYEIVLINDGSADATASIAAAMANEDPHVVAVNLSRNYGHQIALSAGLSLCRGQRVFILDADLQDPPELLGRMMALMDDGADVVYGVRAERADESWFKRLSAKLFYRLLSRLAEVGIPIDTGDFRLINRRTIDILNAMPERSRFIRGMVSWIGFRQVPLTFERQARFSGKTGYPLRKMIRLAVDAITSFSTLPLRITSYIGAGLGIAGIGMIIYTLASWLMGHTVQGWTSIMIVVLVIGCVQLLSLGIFGEYLGRLYMESKQRPLFVIDTVTSQRPVTLAPPPK